MYDDETARVWDAAMGKEILRVKHGDAVASVAFFPDGRWAVSNVRSKTVYVWQMATGDVIARLEHGASIKSVAISCDGRWVASGGDDRTARVWEAATGKEIGRVEHRASVPSVAISPDERWLASASGNVVGIHSLRPEELIAPTCLRLWRNFTRDGWGRYVPGVPYRKTCPDLP